MGVSARRPLRPHSWSRSSPLEGGAAPEPLIRGETYGRAELVLEIFIDQVKVTLILKSVRILLGKEMKSNRSGKEQTTPI